MTNEQAKKMLKAKLECLKRETSGTDFDCNNSNCDECSLCYEQGNMGEQKEALDMAIKALEQQPCEMTAEEYRQRMIQAFHNADADELIAVCVLPTEKEFEQLEWLLKKHYKKEPCEGTISRQAAIDAIKQERKEL